MNIKQLETFVEIARCGSFAGAAERLRATPSTISARIQELEADLNILLFDRAQKKTRLTAKGRELQTYAERVLAACAEIRMRVGDGEAVAGHIRLGVAELVAVTWLPAFVEAIHRRYPNLMLELNVALTADIQQALANGDIDMALLPGSRFEARFNGRSLGRVRFAWMAGSTAGLPERTIVPADLRDRRILSLGRRSYHHQTVAQWLDAPGDEPRAVDLCNSMGAIASLAQAGVGVSLLPVQCYDAEIKAGSLHVLRTEPEGPLVEFFALYPADARHLPSHLSALAAEASTFKD